MPGHEDKKPFGNRPQRHLYTPFPQRKIQAKRIIRGYGYQGGGSRDGWAANASKAGIGVDFKNSIKLPGPWRIGFGGFGECLPYHSNYVEIDKDKLDAWGIPTLKIHCEWGDNEKTMSKDIAGAGCRNARRRRRQGHVCLSGYVPTWLGHSRNGHRPHGPRSQDLRLE